MSIEINLKASFSDAYSENYNPDVEFYHSIPNSEIDYRDSVTGESTVPMPNGKQTIIAIISAILSSTVLSTAIHTYLTTHSTHIEITVDNNNGTTKVTYEGPNIKESQPEIQKTIESIIEGNSKKQLKIKASRKTPGDHIHRFHE